MGSPLAKSMSIGMREDEGHRRGESGTIHLPTPDEEDEEEDEEEYSSMRHMLGAVSPQPASGRTSQQRHRPASSSGSSHALYLLLTCLITLLGSCRSMCAHQRRRLQRSLTKICWT